MGGHPIADFLGQVASMFMSQLAHIDKRLAVDAKMQGCLQVAGRLVCRHQEEGVEEVTGRAMTFDGFAELGQHRGRMQFTHDQQKHMGTGWT